MFNYQLNPQEVNNEFSLLNNELSLLNKVGTVKAFSGSTPPDGWFFCDGAAISRTTYAALFAVIGTAYGAGDGSTTFNLPNLNVLGQTSPVTVYGNGRAITYTDSQTEFALASSNNDPGRVQPSIQLTYGNIGAQPNGGWVKNNRAVGLAINTTHGLTGIVGMAHLDNASQTARAIIKY